MRTASSAPGGTSPVTVSQLVVFAEHRGGEARGGGGGVEGDGAGLGGRGGLTHLVCHDGEGV